MKLQLENLSVEKLKVLREDINLLLKNKYEPKYKENTCFINPKDLSFLCIHCIMIMQILIDIIELL